MGSQKKLAAGYLVFQLKIISADTISMITALASPLGGDNASITIEVA